MNERFFELRKALKLSQEQLGKTLGVTRSSISNIETGRFNLTDTMINLLCVKYNVNESWLRTGQGEMFNELPEEDEVALIVSELLEEDNPFYQRVKNAVKIYMSLSPQSQDVINDFVNQLFEHEKKED
ncbi:MAG: helix-turn-helix domain-containing protein [Acetivibrio ethanolgignens]